MAGISTEPRALNGHIIAQAPNPPKDPPLPAPSQLSHLPDHASYSTSHISTSPHLTHAQDSSSKLPASLKTITALTDAVNRNASVSKVAESTQMSENGGPSPYGTRSRNRNGNARPNYAEDRDMETEMEWNSAKKSNVNPKNAVIQEGSTHDETLSATHNRRSSTVSSNPPNAKATPSQNTKDNLPGMSTFALRAETNGTGAPQSKKRKAPGSGLQGSIPMQNATNSHTNGSSTRSLAVGRVGVQQETNMMTFEKSGAVLKNGQLVADDGTTLQVHDHVYLICEPPGEPYYLARIMEFIHVDNNPSLHVEELRVNWYYRPRDISRKPIDTRVVFASMHSDTCALTSLRGKCYIRHRSEVTIEDCKKSRDTFWFGQMYDRYIHRYYEVVPTNTIINVPPHVKKVLDERWKYVLVEIGRSNHLTDPSKQCQRCGLYCSASDSVDCAVCRNTYHMNCVQPPLQRKPARGFGWSCGPCSRRQEKRLEARNIPSTGNRSQEGDEEEVVEEEEEESNGAAKATPDIASESHTPNPHPATAEQVAFARMWQFRYLGIHCAAEDALDYDDRIYPRASSRLGPKHQANIHVWHGHPVEYVKASEIRKKYAKNPSHKKDGKLSKETLAALEAERAMKEKRPKWVLDEPHGFVRRGEDYANDEPANTAKLKFRLPNVGDISSRGLEESSSCLNGPGDGERLVDGYMTRAKKLAGSLGFAGHSTNFLDKALELFYAHKYDPELALQQLKQLQRRKDFKEPELSKEEMKKFEDGVLKYGSELSKVSRHIGKSQKHGEIVRLYYMWQKTPNGRRIRDQHKTREGKKANKHFDSRLVDDVADDADDSAFDNEKAEVRKRGFECKFCSIRHSTAWRRAPHTAPGTMVNGEGSGKGNKDKHVQLTVALCSRCANLWRRYAIQYEDIEEVAKKVAGGGGRAWKRKADEELLIELVGAQQFSFSGVSSSVASAASSIGLHVASILSSQPPPEPVKKKQKVVAEPTPPAQVEPLPEPIKKKVVEKPPEPPLIPEEPRFIELPCRICSIVDESNGPLLSCRHCRLTVHRQCYGDPDRELPVKWVCDQCLNDSSSQISNTYECRLCPVEHTDLVEIFAPPKASHKKKTDREREKERLEKEMVIEKTEQYRRDHMARGWPLHPREAMKSTSGDNWVHILCAVFHPEIRFGDAKSLERAECIGSIPTNRWSQICQVCGGDKGVCVNCKQCAATYHITCAQSFGHQIGFDVAPVKVSRRDAVNIVTMGEETGHATPVVYCKEHVVKATVHPFSEVNEGSKLNALQQFCRAYKQADLSLTGTVRKAAMINPIGKPGQGTSQTPSQPSINGHHESTPSTPVQVRSSRTLSLQSAGKLDIREVALSSSNNAKSSPRHCSRCGVDVSPVWHEETVETEQNLDRTMFPANSAANMDIPRLTNGLTNGHANSAASDDDHAPTRPAESDHDDDRDGQTKGKANASSKVVVFRCHKCYLKKTREPTPARSPSPKEPPESSSVEREVPTNAVQLRSPPPLPADARRDWPPPPSTMAPHEPMPPRAWGFDHQPMYPGDVIHSPPPIPPPRTSMHYEGPPVHAPYPPPMYSQPIPRPDMLPQHPVNGLHPPYARRDSQNFHVHPVYGPPPRREEPPPMSPADHRYHGPPPHVMPHQPPVPQARVARSPSIHDGPHGIPRAAENPFAVADASPRDEYGRPMYGAPYRDRPRPETPPPMPRRTSGWGSNDGQVNGASASPSVHNLLS